MADSAIETIDGVTFKRLFFAALTWFQHNYQAVNVLNVFPVPDGDTGTNMLLTIQRAYKEIETQDDSHLGHVAAGLAQGALLGARGNSGVILSQILRGMANVLKPLSQMTVHQFANALQEGSVVAYRGVVRPIEGTILTVIRETAAAASHLTPTITDFRQALPQILTACQASIDHTPELLPILKQAQVVDSGGYGLGIIFEGMTRLIMGESLAASASHQYQALDLASVGSALETVEPGQDWEVVVDFRPHSPLDLDSFYAHLTRLGTSIQVGQGESIWRMHIHLPKASRFEPITYIETLGTITNIALENLLDQMEQQQRAAQPKPLQLHAGQLVAVTVSPGSGFHQIFSQPGVAVVGGGQTMNPSTQELLNAFADLPTEHVILLPNNKNIQLAAEQAAQISSKNVRVVPSRTVPQGIAALLAFDPDGTIDDVTTAMTARLTDVTTLEITTATKTVELDGVAVEAGQTIALHNGKLLCTAASVDETVWVALKTLDIDSFGLLTLYVGETLTLRDAATLAEQLAAAYPDLTVEHYFGGQPHYPYIISLE